VFFDPGDAFFGEKTEPGDVFFTFFFLQKIKNKKHEKSSKNVTFSLRLKITPI